jgi:hypothetical protein
MPPQWSAPPACQGPRRDDFALFSQPDSDRHIVRDITEGGARRWTRDHPEMRFWLDPAAAGPLIFAMSITVPEVGFRNTGAVHIAVYVNGQRLGTLDCPHPGDFRFQMPVPRDWVAGSPEVRVLAEPDRVWTIPGDPAHVGYQIETAGFIH